MSNKKILILPGDGIGNEVMAEVLKIIDWMEKTKSLSFDISERLVGGTAYEIAECLVGSEMCIRDSFNTSAITSLPIPSPGKIKIFLLLIFDYTIQGWIL